MADFSTDYNAKGGITTTTSAPTLGAMPGLDPHLSDIANQILQMKLARQQREDAEAARRATAQAQDESIARSDSMEARRRTTGDNVQSAGYKSWLDAGGIRPAGHTGGLGSSSANGMPGTVQQQMQQFALRDAGNQIQSKERVAPVRMVQGPGIVPGYTTDPDAMSGYQRQDFLPQGSQQVGR